MATSETPTRLPSSACVRPRDLRSSEARTPSFTYSGHNGEMLFAADFRHGLRKTVHHLRWFHHADDSTLAEIGIAFS